MQFQNNSTREFLTNNNTNSFFSLAKQDDSPPSNTSSSRSRRKTNSSKNTNGSDDSNALMTLLDRPTTRKSDPLTASQLKVVKGKTPGIKKLYSQYDDDLIRQSQRDSPLVSTAMSGTCGTMHTVKQHRVSGVKLVLQDETTRDATYHDIKQLQHALVKVPAAGDYNCIFQELQVYKLILKIFQNKKMLKFLPVVFASDGEMVTSVVVNKMPLVSRNFSERWLKFDENKKVVMVDPSLEYPIYEKLTPMESIAQYKNVTTANLRTLVQQLLLVLIALDQRGMTYYDLKIENMLLRENEQGTLDLVIADIGSILPYDADESSKPRTSKVSNVLHRKFQTTRKYSTIRNAANAEWRSHLSNTASTTTNSLHYDRKGVLYSVGVLLEELMRAVGDDDAWLKDTCKRFMFLEGSGAFQDFDEALSWTSGKVMVNGGSRRSKQK
jgi:hypothetical protein